MGDFNFDFNFVKTGTPLVTLSSIGIAFNVGARNMLGNPDSINIGFDESRNAIAVRSSDSDSEAPSYEFAGREKDGWVRISMRDFMKYLSQRTGIDFLSKAVQFIPEYNTSLQMLVLIVDSDHRKDKNK